MRETGLIHPEDELRQVNGVTVTDRQPDDVIQLIVRETYTYSDIYCLKAYVWKNVEEKNIFRNVKNVKNVEK